MNGLDYQRIFHEIKNTITLINSSMQLLDQRCSQLKTELYWDNIKNEITYLKNMVLEISKAGSMEQLQKDSVDLNSIVLDLCRFMKDSYSDLKWKLNLSEELPCVYADQIKLKQAVLNLIKNSAEAGSTYVIIETHAAGSHIQIAIIDNGGGISAELVDKVFDLFTTSKKQGSGLGLAITKQIIECHDGTLELNNQPGKGCTFTIELPAAAL
ncbi:MAG: ATP-binding protein [Eubacterium sp.]|nr:ATP-binding protein [Eubacterium sp.]MCI8919599.1 ATP-binding protein [Eubacterium sp.]